MNRQQTLQLRALFLGLALMIPGGALPVATAQESGEGRELRTFEEHPPLRQMECGLWINAMGDVAYKDIAATGQPVIDLSDPDARPDDDLGAEDFYISWAYNAADTLHDFLTELKEIVDTLTFRALGPEYFADDSHIYILHPMVYGGYMIVGNDIDPRSFRVFKEAPHFARDKNLCFVAGQQIGGADAGSFKPIPNAEYLLARDKYHIYHMSEVLDEEEIASFEALLGVRIRRPHATPKECLD